MKVEKKQKVVWNHRFSVRDTEKLNNLYMFIYIILFWKINF